MLDIDAGKLLIVGIIALLVIGPKELPRVLRQLGQWTGRLRRMASEFQGQFMDAMREADLENIRKEVASVATSAQVETNFDPAVEVHKELTSALEWKPITPGNAEAPALSTANSATDLAAASGSVSGSAGPALDGAATAVPEPTPQPAIVDEALARAPRRSAGRPKVLKLSPRAKAAAAAAQLKTKRANTTASLAVRKRSEGSQAATAAASAVPAEAAAASPES